MTEYDTVKNSPRDPQQSNHLKHKQPSFTIITQTFIITLTFQTPQHN